MTSHGAMSVDVSPPINPRLFSFIGGSVGRWKVRSMRTLVGPPLPAVERVDIQPGYLPLPKNDGEWVLHGATSNERYVTRDEKNKLVHSQSALGRDSATCSAIIPIRKSEAWWALTQDERRAVFESRSKHTEIGLRYLPAIARRLHHCRDLTERQPFDFITLFDYAPSDEAAFDDLLSELRSMEEWRFVDREVDIRLEL